MVRYSNGWFMCYVLCTRPTIQIQNQLFELLILITGLDVCYVLDEKAITLILQYEILETLVTYSAYNSFEWVSE